MGKARYEDARCGGGAVAKQEVLHARPPGRAWTELLLELVKHADVLIENFRPGTLERWNIGPDRLLEANPRLVVARVSVTANGSVWPSGPGSPLRRRRWAASGTSTASG